MEVWSPSRLSLSHQSDPNKQQFVIARGLETPQLQNQGWGAAFISQNPSFRAPKRCQWQGSNPKIGNDSAPKGRGVEAPAREFWQQHRMPFSQAGMNPMSGISEKFHGSSRRKDGNHAGNSIFLQKSYNWSHPSQSHPAAVASWLFSNSGAH